MLKKNNVLLNLNLFIHYINNLNNIILEKSNIDIKNIFLKYYNMSIIFIKRMHILLTTVDHKRLRVMYIILRL